MDVMESPPVPAAPRPRSCSWTPRTGQERTEPGWDSSEDNDNDNSSTCIEQSVRRDQTTLVEDTFITKKLLDSLLVEAMAEHSSDTFASKLQELQTLQGRQLARLEALSREQRHRGQATVTPRGMDGDGLLQGSGGWWHEAREGDPICSRVARSPYTMCSMTEQSEGGRYELLPESTFGVNISGNGSRKDQFRVRSELHRENSSRHDNAGWRNHSVEEGCSTDEHATSEREYLNVMPPTVGRNGVPSLLHRMWEGFSVDDYAPCMKPERVRTTSESSTSVSNKSAAKKPKEWTPKITVPEPFGMTVREEERRRHGVKSRSARRLEKLVQEQQKQEAALEALRKTPFRATPVPAHTLKPLFTVMHQDKRQSNRKSNTTSRDEKTMTKAQQTEVRDKGDAGNQRGFRARPVPRSVYDPAVTERIREDELYRKIRVRVRADKTLRESAMPGSMAHRAASTKRTRHACYSISKQKEQQRAFPPATGSIQIHREPPKDLVQEKKFHDMTIGHNSGTNMETLPRDRMQGVHIVFEEQSQDDSDSARRLSALSSSSSVADDSKWHGGLTQHWPLAPSQGGRVQVKSRSRNVTRHKDRRDSLSLSDNQWDSDYAEHNKRVTPDHGKKNTKRPSRVPPLLQ